MTNILGWSGVWLGILLSPEKTAKQLKKDRPGMVDGFLSFGLLNFIIGVLGFLVTTLLSLYLGSAMSNINPGFATGGLLIMLVIFFGLEVIAYPICMIIILLILTAFFKLASVLLKGKSSFGELCGLLGVVGSAYLLVMVVLGLIVYVPMMVAIILFKANTSALALVYFLMGVAYLITMPFIQLVMALFFDLLADVEKVSIYRSGAMTGLAMGIVMFLLMVTISAMMFFVGSLMGGYHGNPYTPTMYE